MTKEELKQEAKVCFKNLDDCKTKELMIEAYIVGAEPREKEIKSLGERCLQLQKENAELKERIKTLTIHDTNAVLSGLEMKVLKESHRDRANKTQGQLSKAKEIIKSFITLLTKSRTALDTKTCLMKAEQFLKEVEE